MFRRSSISVFAFVAALFMQGAASAQEPKLPDWSGQWIRVEGGQPRYDHGKPPNRGQQAPLTVEYQAIYEAGLSDQANGGQGLDPGQKCIPAGMPRQMSGFFPFEFINSPGVTHVLFEYSSYTTRRIYTDGRDWPKDEEPSFAGYSIGKWLDTDGDGRYDTLEVETRNFKGPRVYDPSGIPMHNDNQTVITERIFLDKANPDLLHIEMTTVDHALRHPWSVAKNFRRLSKVIWSDNNCSERNEHVFIGPQDYLISADGYLMPVRKGQPPPDLRYFKEVQK
jgi:hypothetical protein